MSKRKHEGESVKEHFEREMKDPTFRRLYEVESRKIRLGYMLCQLREKAGMTQAALARRVGVTQGYIARLEMAEKANYEMKTLKKIAAALHRVVVIGFAEERVRGHTVRRMPKAEELVAV